MPEPGEIAPLARAKSGGKASGHLCDLAEMPFQRLPLAFGGWGAVRLGLGVGVGGHDEKGCYKMR